ncbi:unnamed protein product [Thlaspi arvense]|uniref:Thioredoxin domain-containing protein n=1 Tax=Thlaspi arvense TaxID=13288 RepID=A0AAU9RE73_THLAR|nr:unnamed protein product [Thlaspi arvense]
MEKKVLYGLVVMLTYLVGSGFSQVKNEEAEWELLLTEAQQPIIATVTSSLCGVPCALLEEQVYQLTKTYGDQIIFYKADIIEKPFFAKLYKVLRVPTLIVFKGGKEIKRLEKGFYWGAVYDLIITDPNILSSSDSSTPLFDALQNATSNSNTLSPSDSAPCNCSLFEAIQNATSSSWEETVVEAQLPIVLTLTSPLCGDPCVNLMSQVARLAEAYGNRTIFFYTADILEEPFFARLYKVVIAPAVIVIKDGEVVFRYERLSNWGNIYDLLFESVIFDPALSPSDSPSPSPSPF